MTKWALIVNDAVYEITEIDPAGRFSPDMFWVECPNSTKIGYLYSGGEFSKPLYEMDQAKADRIEQLRSSCEAAIVGGFTSGALGAAHSYPSDIKAQINLMGSVTDSLLPGLPSEWKTPFWVCDEEGNWSFKLHNAGQIQQAGRDGKAHVVECQATLEGLTALVLSANNTDDVEAVVWPVA